MRNAMIASLVRNDGPADEIVLAGQSYEARVNHHTLCRHNLFAFKREKEFKLVFVLAANGSRQLSLGDG